MLGNDTDADSDPLTAVLDTDVSHGTLSLGRERRLHLHADLRLQRPGQLHLPRLRRHRRLERRHRLAHRHGRVRDHLLRGQHRRACSDAGPGTIAAPFCTIGKAASLVAAGETVHVLAGTYAETVNGPNSGTAGNPITYTAGPA